MSDISSHNDSSMFRDVEAEYELLRSQNKELSERNEVSCEMSIINVLINT